MIQTGQTKHATRKYIDLHAHLDGSITPAIARRLAQIQQTALPADDDVLAKMLSVPETCTSLNDFLKCFALPCSLLQTPETVNEAVYLVLESMRQDGVIYAELRFAPQLHMNLGMSQEDAVKAALSGLARAQIPANLILCCMRGDGNDVENEQTLRLAHTYLTTDNGVVALDLAGAEALYPTRRYIPLFEKAVRNAIPFTMHAGEATDGNDVITAIRMGASRIGHGVRIHNNPQALELVKSRQIPLELCPTSNRMTHAVTDMADYPLVRFLDYGIKVTINTDDMAIEQTTLSSEFIYIRKKYGITPQQEELLLLNAVDAAFTSARAKHLLRRTILNQ